MVWVDAWTGGSRPMRSTDDVTHRAPGVLGMFDEDVC
jgi:hypothetical protein